MSTHDNTYEELIAMVESLRDEMTVAHELSGLSFADELQRVNEDEVDDENIALEKRVLREWADDDGLVEQFDDGDGGISLSDWLNDRVIDWVEHAQRRMTGDDQEWTTTHIDVTFCTGGPAIWAELHEGYGYLKGVWGTDTITRTLRGSLARQAFEDMAWDI